MNNKFLDMMIELGRLDQMLQRKASLSEFNQSENGIFWAIAQICASKPDTKLFSLVEINSYLGYTRPNISQTLNKLEDRCYIERIVLKNDRRATYIRLTEKCINALNEKYSDICCKFDKIIAKFGEDDTDKLIELLSRFTDVCNDIK